MSLEKLQFSISLWVSLDVCGKVTILHTSLSVFQIVTFLHVSLCISLGILTSLWSAFKALEIFGSLKNSWNPRISNYLISFNQKLELWWLAVSLATDALWFKFWLSSPCELNKIQNPNHDSCTWPTNSNETTNLKFKFKFKLIFKFYSN